MSTPINEMDDKQLSILASKQDKKAFDILIERHCEYMMAVSQRYTDTYHEAQDIFQKGCLKAWKAMPNFRQDCHFKTWIYRVVRSAAYDHNAWKKRKAEVSFESFFTGTTSNVVATQRGDTEISRNNPKNSPDYHRKGNPAAKEWGTTLFEMVVEKTSQPDKSLEVTDNNKELGEKLNFALDRLPPLHREVLELFSQGMTYEEIAKMQKCALGTVMSRLFYARKKAQKLCSNIKNHNQNV
tara:strand:- start:41 stop:760 length:720 start_codon:yes stop_codon:yes gene_type:complete